MLLLWGLEILLIVAWTSQLVGMLSFTVLLGWMLPFMLPLYFGWYICCPSQFCLVAVAFFTAVILRLVCVLSFTVLSGWTLPFWLA